MRVAAASNHDLTTRARRDRAIALVGLAVAVFSVGVPGMMMLVNPSSGVRSLGAGIVVTGYSLMSLLAVFAAWTARRGATGIEARTWRYIAIGLMLWTGGGVAYIAYLITGGNPLDPVAWSQIGYLGAYPFWYMAMWGLRQPVLASSRKRQAEIILVEVTVLLVFSLVVGSILWNPEWPVSQNVAQLVPAIMDVLLLATFYGAVRRSRWSSATSLIWVGYAFALLAFADMLLTYAVARGYIAFGGISSVGYITAMVFVIIGSRRPLRLAEVQNRVRGTTGIVSVGGLTLSGLAIVVAPGALRPIVLLGGCLLAWRTFAILSERDNSDSDLLTGFLEPRAFERHLGSVIQLSTEDRPALLVALDLDGFGAWNARNGYNAGDALLASVATTLESSGPDATRWGRLKADRFAFTTISRGDAEDRAIAELLRAAAAQAAAPLAVRAALVRIPEDARVSAEVIDAADEALRAGSESGRPIVAYARGSMDGVLSAPGRASLAGRRERIQELIGARTSIEIFLQPIVRIEDLAINGFEALSRFDVEPRRGPDEWIAEATHLGMGIDLEMECMRRAWRRLHDVPASAHLAINLSPDAIMSDLFTEEFADQDLAGLVVEVTEHERVSNYPRLAARLAALRGRGARIAIDDTGAGHASLNHLIELRPDYIKLDRQLVSGLDLDAGKHALVRNMFRLADDLGARLVAEGIETEGELFALRELGVPLGQGYFLGRPTPNVECHIEHLAAAADDLRVPVHHRVS